jgi:hypothetical protein
MRNARIAATVVLLLPLYTQANVLADNGKGDAVLAQAKVSKVSLDTPIQLDIPAGDLMDALKALAKQTGTDLVYLPKQLAGLKTTGLKGELTAKDAVERLLKGTNLRTSTDAATGALLIAAAEPITSSNIEQIAGFQVTLADTIAMRPLAEESSDGSASSTTDTTSKTKTPDSSSDPVDEMHSPTISLTAKPSSGRVRGTSRISSSAA